MAGEWLPIDCNLGTKPEVLELVDETGVPVEVAVYRLIQLWSWAVMNTADGTLRATPARLALVAGGDDQFWLAVERVGWVSFADGCVTITGWDKRFSRAAKVRAENARRACAFRARKALPQERRGEEKRKELQPAAPAPESKPPKASRSRAKPRISWAADAGWGGISDEDRAAWATAYPAAVIDQELAKASEWLKANPKRAGNRNWRRFLVNWLAKCQERGGSVREAGRRPEDKPPPKRWLDEYRPAAYRRPAEAAALATAKKLKEEDL